MMNAVQKAKLQKETKKREQHAHANRDNASVHNPSTRERITLRSEQP